MAKREIQPEVREVFSKYVKNFVQRLKKPNALEMLKTEFNMSDSEAEIFFELFDKDHNQELSLWEFQQFYTTVGNKMVSQHISKPIALRHINRALHNRVIPDRCLKAYAQSLCASEVLNAHDMIQSFHRLEKDHTGNVDISLAFDTLKGMKTAEGKQLPEEEIELLLKSTAGEEKSIDLPKFINLMCRLKMRRVHE